MQWEPIDASQPPMGRVEFYIPEDGDGNKEQVVLREWKFLTSATQNKITHWRVFFNPADCERIALLKSQRGPEKGCRSNSYDDLMDTIFGKIL